MTHLSQLLLEKLLAPTACLEILEAHFLLLVNLLKGLAVDCDKRGSQSRMAVHQHLKRPAQSAHVQQALDLHGTRNVVGGALGSKLLEEPQCSLTVRAVMQSVRRRRDLSNFAGPSFSTISENSLRQFRYCRPVEDGIHRQARAQFYLQSMYEFDRLDRIQAIASDWQVKIDSRRSNAQAAGEIRNQPRSHTINALRRRLARRHGDFGLRPRAVAPLFYDHKV